MRFTSTLSTLAVVPVALAFPQMLMERYGNNPEMIARASKLLEGGIKRQAGADSATALFEAAPTFDAASQYIDVGPGSGHEWQAPGPNDLRGECPGLNAFANHGFLPRNGYATIAQFINATTYVVGMGEDLAAFLAVLGAAIDSGDGQAWSIGGTPGPGIGSVAASGGHGLIGSHNKYESDASPTRPDLYQSGNNYLPQADQFQQLIDTSPNGVITLDSLTSFRAARFDTQKTNNPYFFNGPFTGVLVQPAAYTFIYRFMANHTAQDPVGILTYETLQSWFGVTGTNGNYTPQFGYERIPANWYRRAQAYPYSIPYFLGDVTAAAALHPEFLDVGGNLGQPNTFTGVDVSDLSGGVFNSAGLLQGNNLGCFAYQFAAQARADLIVQSVLNQLQNVVGSIVTQLSCPQLQAIDASDLEQFPGYTKAPVYGK